MSLLKANYAWTVLVHNCDFSNGVFALKPLVILVTDFNEEVFVGLPDVIIVNIDSNNFFFLRLAHRVHFIDRIVVFWSLGCIVQGSHPETNFFLNMLNDDDFHVPAAFCHGVV